MFGLMCLLQEQKLDTKLDIGKFDIHDGRVIIDEAGVEYNNRDFKNFSREQLKFSNIIDIIN